ncbi:MAG: hypothetical protein AAF638_01960, partial [Pseudomonadota bacterium]
MTDTPNAPKGNGIDGDAAPEKDPLRDLPHDDPLAELARLVSEDNPFAEPMPAAPAYERQEPVFAEARVAEDVAAEALAAEAVAYEPAPSYETPFYEAPAFEEAAPPVEAPDSESYAETAPVYSEPEPIAEEPAVFEDNSVYGYAVETPDPQLDAQSAASQAFGGPEQQPSLPSAPAVDVADIDRQLYAMTHGDLEAERIEPAPQPAAEPAVAPVAPQMPEPLEPAPAAMASTVEEPLVADPFAPSGDDQRARTQEAATGGFSLDDFSRELGDLVAGAGSGVAAAGVAGAAASGLSARQEPVVSRGEPAAPSAKASEPSLDAPAPQPPRETAFNVAPPPDMPPQQGFEMPQDLSTVGPPPSSVAPASSGTPILAEADIAVQPDGDPFDDLDSALVAEVDAVIAGTGAAATAKAKPGRRKGMMIAAAVLGVVVLGGISAVAFRGLTGGGDDGDIAVIAASEEPLKVRPDDPGGETIPHQDRLVFDGADGSATSADGTRIVPREETVVALPDDGAKDVARVPVDGQEIGTPERPRVVTPVAISPDGTIVRAPAESEAPVATGEIASVPVQTVPVVPVEPADAAAPATPPPAVISPDAAVTAAGEAAATAAAAAAATPPAE